MDILDNYLLGNIVLKNRIVMAPMTRCRAINNTPNDLMVEYYQQRASAGLIITEGTSPSPSGLGYPRIPGAFSDAQIEGWKKITNAVHKKEGKIFVQLMHTGRITGKANLPEGSITLAPSAVPAAGEIFTETGMITHDLPKAMTIDEIDQIQNDYANAAYRLVHEAKVDGVEIHAANGYLLNQFLNPRSNQRTDEYGGDYKNRSRFIIETTMKIINKIGADKVGIRFSPYGSFNDMEADHTDVKPMFKHLAEALSILNIAYIHVVGQPGLEHMAAIEQTIKDTFKGTVIAGGEIDTLEKSEAILKEGYDLAYVGRPYIANPDFVEKIYGKKKLTVANSDLFYSSGSEGYIDYIQNN